MSSWVEMIQFLCLGDGGGGEEGIEQSPYCIMWVYKRVSNKSMGYIIYLWDESHSI